MNISLANRLSLLRRESNLSEDELSAFINVPVNRIRTWETAESEPTASELFELSKIYHISIDELIKNEAAAGNTNQVSLDKTTEKSINSGGFIREKRPEHYTDREIYPDGYNKKNAFTSDTHAGGVQFVGASQDGFQNTPYTKAEDIKPRDTSHIKFDEPENPNIKVKTVKDDVKKGFDSASNSINDLIGKIPPETAAKISGAIGKAGQILGDTIDKVGEGIKKSANSDTNPEYHYDYSYDSPPAAGGNAKQQYYSERARAKQQKKEEKWRAKAILNEKKKHRSLFYKTFPLLMTTLFFVFGGMGGWEWSWMLFLLIPIYYSLVEAIDTDDLRRFAYPVAAVLGYLFTGMFFDMWMGSLFMFATIPFYYIVADHIKMKKDDKKYGNNNFENTAENQTDYMQR